MSDAAVGFGILPPNMKTALLFLAVAASVLTASATDGWINMDSKHHLLGRKVSDSELEFRPVLVLRVRNDCDPSRKAITMVRDLRDKYQKKGLTIFVSDTADHEATRSFAGVVGDLPCYSRADAFFCPYFYTNVLDGVTNKISGAVKGCRNHPGMPDPYVVGPSGLVAWKGRGGYVPAKVESEVENVMAMMTDEGLERDFREGAKEHPGFILHKLNRYAKLKRGKMPAGLAKLHAELKGDASCVKLAAFFDEMLKLTKKQLKAPQRRKQMLTKLDAAKQNATENVAGEIAGIETLVFDR